MNKKFLSAILFGALMVTSTGTFVSCKDYDDDIKDLQEQINKKASIEELQSKLDALTTDLSAAKTTAEDAKKAAEAAKDEVASAAADAKKAAVEAAEAKVKEMQKELEDAINSKLDDVNALITKVNTLVSEVSNIVGKRLTNLVFIPSTYIDGIEAIKFSTLTYKPWTKLLADETDGTTAVTINDGKTAVEYLVSPSTLKAENIKSVGIVASTATNILNPSSRAATAAPIEATIDGEVVNGVLKLNLKKTQEETFGGSDNNSAFTIVALKAEAQLTAEEEKQGVDPFVYSDWARLYEESVTPYIHYNKYKITPEVTEDLANEVAPHFYPYYTIHTATEENGINTTEGKFIIENLAYTQKLDLNTLVKVCDKNGNEYIPANYGLKFEFALVNYYLKDTEASEEKTNQKEFAALSAAGILTSQARNGVTNNKDAIGREPMIQVVLKDINNGKVVDVRYFKVKWTSENSQKPLGELKEFTADYTCGKTYENTVLTADMNDKIYTAINISKEDFHRLYTLEPVFYATEAAVKAGTPDSDILGSVEDIKAEGSTTTHNLKWTFDINTNAAIQSEYAAGKAERIVYARYVNVNDAHDFYYFSLKLTLNIKKMTLAKGYFQGNWNVSGDALAPSNVNKTFQVNPSLTSDAIFGLTANYQDCQLIADLKDGYFEKPATVLELVKNAETADFVFDADRINAVLGTAWSVSVDGKSLLKGLEVAAVIDVNEAGEAFIALNETSRGKNGQPTAAACELIGKNVPVKLAAEYCTLTQDVDNFLVNFMTPLAVTIIDPTDHFHDLITGGSAISVKGLASISETFGLERLVMGMKDDAEYKNDELISWYKVQDIIWAASEAKTNLEVKTNADGTKSLIIGTGKNTKWSDITVIYPKMELTFDATKQELVFNNASGTHLQQSFELYIPVKVQTKWGTEVKEITVTVDPK